MAFATVLGVLPLTVMIFLPFFKPHSIHWGNVAGFHAQAGRAAIELVNAAPLTRVTHAPRRAERSSG